MSLVGKQAPEFHLPSTKNLDTLDEPVSLSDYRGRWLVLFFYPMDFTFVCPTEILAFSQCTADFEQAGASVLAVSTDSVYCHQAWMEFGLGKLAFPLGSDVTHQVCRDYGVLIEDEGIAMRGLYLIDPQGVVRYEVIHDGNTGRNVEEVLRVLRGLQTGKRVPANWQPGQPCLEATAA
jgi:peroxiredoxin 2/4